MGQKTKGLVVIGGVTVFLVLLVAASFLADEQRAVPVSRLQRTVTDSPRALAPGKEHWYASGQGPDDSHHPITWRDIIRSNYPAEPRYGPSEAELYREDPSSFAMRVVRPGAPGGSMLHTSPDAPSAMDGAKDRWYMAGQYDDHGVSCVRTLAHCSGREYVLWTC